MRQEAFTNGCIFASGRKHFTIAKISGAGFLDVVRAGKVKA